MSNEDNDKSRENEQLLAAIETELADILVREHGMDGVRVSLDRETGEIVSSQTIPDHLKPVLFAMAAKRAIIKRVREEEQRGE